jgi:type I restriction-modification system DNA methylase subunit
MDNNLERLRSITSFHELVTYLRDELDWEFETEDVEDLTYDYSAAEFGLDVKSAAAIREIKQLRPIVEKQPWGIFYLDFKGQQVSVSILRAILRGLVAKKRASANQSEMRKWRVEDLLFICTSDEFTNFNFAYFRGTQTNRAVLSTFGWHRGDTHLRTLAEYNLPALSFPSDTSNSEEWLKKWRAAFDVEKVTDEFFRRYNEVFTTVELEIRPAVKDDRHGRLFTQKLFNRLMFIYFIQKKGWLSFKDNPKSKYLRALFNDAVAKKENFFRDRLYWLFFRGMSVADLDLGQTEEQLREKRGEVPPLNGGLFELEDELDVRGRVPINNDVFGLILNLFERYNFTIEESTPLDVQVAVDPEMLGKVFEELVTGRPETGSYYTPRPIVSFMCREALKHYINGVQPSKEAVAKFVDEEDASDLQNPEAVLDALKRVRVCDPACGSGAYLLGMLHELMRLRAALFRSNKFDDKTLYERKRWIIENNLYGVDIDKFAVQIACLRLWLSLAIDSDKPRPLPNLDFKIECGDSLIAPAPSETEKQMTFARTAMVNEFRQTKGEYMREDDPERKRQLRQRIDKLRGEIALALKHQLPRLDEGQVQKRHQEISLLEMNIGSARNPSIKTELQKQAKKLRLTIAANESASTETDTGFDWAVEFAEVFMPESLDKLRLDGLQPMLNDSKQQGALGEEFQPSTGSAGFDIIVANPPYVRQELLARDYKGKRLKLVYPEVYSGTADLYVYFYARALQLLSKSGVGVFISSKKWLRASYGERLRQELLDKKAFHLIVDFGDLPVFKATAYPGIFLWQQDERHLTSTRWATVENLETCYSEGIREHIARISQELPASQFGVGKRRVSISKSEGSIQELENVGPNLGSIVKSEIFNGIKTGLNEAFLVSLDAYDRLIDNDSNSIEVLKPLLVGDDIRRYDIHFRQTYLIYITWETEIGRYPGILNHLKAFKRELEQRDGCKNGGTCPWYALSRPRPETTKVYDSPKIIYPQISNGAKFYLDTKGFFINQKCFTIHSRDWYLLGVLNSSSVWRLIKTNSPPLRGGYSEPRRDFMLSLPIPDARTPERESLAKLASLTQALHTKRRNRVEEFLREIGTDSAKSNSRNPLEQPWALSAEEFTRRTKRALLKVFNEARDETSVLTEEISGLEREIDESVAALYGVPLDPVEKIPPYTRINPPEPFK